MTTMAMMAAAASRFVAAGNLAKISTTKAFGLRCRPQSTSAWHEQHGSAYSAAYRRSMTDPDQFWAEVAENTVWTKKWDKVCENPKSPFTKWFVGGRLNVCYNAVDRHVSDGHGDRTALIWDSPISGGKDKLSYKQLQEQVSRFSGLLSSLGVSTGDRVLIYMPMVLEAVVAMLACARIGAVHSVVFGGFAAKELSSRIRHCEPKVIVTASCGLEPNRVVQYKPIVDEAISMANAPSAIPVVVLQRPDQCVAQLRPGGLDLDWRSAAAAARPHDCVDVDAAHPLYILYTSGTTGDPKGVQHPSGAHAVVNKWTMKAIYDISPGEVWWAASDLGWIVGHEYICYSPLLNGSTSVVYEGKPVGTPDAGQFYRVISEHGVKAMFMAPTAVRALEREDKEGVYASKYNISSFRNLFVAGELLDPDAEAYAKRIFKVPVLNHWWQTETGHAITATHVGLGNGLNPPKSSTGLPVPGFDVRVLRSDGTAAAPGELGRIVCALPIAPGCFNTLYKADQRFKETYFTKFPGFYDTMDAGEVDEQGYVKVRARADDVINVSGHRLSTSALEEVLLEHEDVVDCAVVGVHDDLKGQVPLGVYVKRKDCSRSDSEISSDLVRMVRASVGPVAVFKQSVAVPGLPKTRSGKIARKSIADLADGKQVKIAATIEDATVYTSIRKALQAVGLAKGAPEPTQ